MAYAFEQAVVGTKLQSGSNPTVTLTGVTAGSLLVLVMPYTSQNRSITSIADDQGGTWARGCPLADASASSCELWYSLNAAGGDTVITCTMDNVSAANESPMALEYSGILTAGAVNGTAVSLGVASGSSSPQTTGTLTTDADGILLVGFQFMQNASRPLTLPVGSYTTRVDETAVATQLWVGDLRQTAAGGETLTMTWTGGTASGVLGLIAFKEIVSGPTISTQPSAATAIVHPSEPAEFTVDCDAALTGVEWQDDGTEATGADIGQVDTLASGTSVLTVTPTVTTRTGSAITAECTDGERGGVALGHPAPVRAGVTETQVSETTDASGEVAGTLATDVQGDALEKMVAFVAIKVDGVELVGPGMWLVGLAP